MQSSANHHLHQLTNKQKFSFSLLLSALTLRRFALLPPIRPLSLLAFPLFSLSSSIRSRLFFSSLLQTRCAIPAHVARPSALPPSPLACTLPRPVFASCFCTPPAHRLSPHGRMCCALIFLCTLCTRRCVGEAAFMSYTTTIVLQKKKGLSPPSPGLKSAGQASSLAQR